MGRMARWYRRIMYVGGGAFLMQAGSCAVTDPQTQQQILDQFVLPQMSSVFSDTVFFFLDNVLVRLTT